jgi:hypothetical protein
MKSRVSIILALLVVFSVGIAEPLHAHERSMIQTEECSVAGRSNPSESETGPGETGETLGDPDGWLGGQNLRPAPPIASGMSFESPEDHEITLGSLYYWFLMYIGLYQR